MSRFLYALKKRPVAFTAVLVLIFLYVLMLFAGFFAPYSPGQSFRQHSYHPPNFTMYSPELGFRPQIQHFALIDTISREYVRVRGEYIPVHLFVHAEPYRLFGIIPTDIHLFGTSEPYQAGGRSFQDGGQNYPVFLFGADHMGRDLFSRIAYGSQISLTIGFVGIAISLTLAILLGGFAGYFGGWIDWLVMRIAEFVILIPGLYLILFLRSVLSRDMDPGQSFMLITVILSFVGWPGSARLVRGLVHAIKREDFIADAQLQGIPTVVIIFRHIIPQMSSILIVSITLGIPGFIMGETVLSYLGLGITDPAVSWGSLINREITTLSNLSSFPWLLLPGLFLLLTTLSFNFLGDLLRDVLDPYHRGKGAA